MSTSHSNISSPIGVLIKQNCAMELRVKLWHAVFFVMMALNAVAYFSAEPSADATARVDVNHATVAELMKVPGMTDVWARRIVRFRPYRRKTDLVDYGVISAEEYGRIRDHVVAHRAGDERSEQRRAR